MTDARKSSRIPLLILLPVAVISIVWMLPGTHITHQEEVRGEFIVPKSAKSIRIEVEMGHVEVVIGAPGKVSFVGGTLRVAQDEETFQKLMAQDFTLRSRYDAETGEFVLRPPPFPTGLEAEYTEKTKSGEEVVRKGRKGMRQFNVRVTVPSDLALEVKCGSGNVGVEFARSPVHVHTGIGTVGLKALTAAAVVHIGKGDVIVDQHRAGLDVFTQSGQVLVLMQEVLKPVKLRSMAGNVRCTVPRHAAFDLDVRTLDGGGISDFQIPWLALGEKGQRMQGKINGGGPLLEIETRKGTVSVLKDR